MSRRPIHRTVWAQAVQANPKNVELLLEWSRLFRPKAVSNFLKDSVAYFGEAS